MASGLSIFMIMALILIAIINLFGHMRMSEILSEIDMNCIKP
jgi:hypothetical protein